MSLRRFTLLILVALPIFAGCANADPSVSIEGALAPDIMCLVQVTNPRIFHGLYDANLGGGYGEPVVYRNRLIVTARAPGPPHAESDDFTVQSAIISLTDVDGTPIALSQAKFLVGATGFVPAATDTMPAESVGTIPIIPASLAGEMAGLVHPGTTLEIVAHIQAKGVSSGGSEITLDDFQWPVTVCNGCLCNTAGPMLSCHPGSDGEGYLGLAPCP